MANVDVQLAAREANAKWFVGLCGALLTAIGTVLTVLKPLKAYDSATHPLLLLGVLAVCMLSFLGSLMSFALCVYYRTNPKRMSRFYTAGTVLFIGAGVALTSLPLLVVALPVTAVVDVSVPTLSIAPEDATRFPITITSSQRRGHTVTLEVIDPPQGVVLTFPSSPGTQPQSASRAVTSSSTPATLVALIRVLDGEPPTRVLARVAVTELDGSLSKDKIFEVTVTPTVRLLTYDVIAEGRAMTAVTFFATANFSGPAEVEVYAAEPVTAQLAGPAPAAGPRGPIALVRGQPVAIPLLLGGAGAGDMRAVVVVRNRHGLLSTSEFRVSGRKS